VKNVREDSMSFVINDRFGPKQVIYCKANKNGFPKGYFTIKGVLYKLEINPSPHSKHPDVASIATVKELGRADNRRRGGGYGGGSYGGGGF
jgi:hypothetical protein